MKKTFEKLRELILDWAFKRGLINKDFSEKQYGKFAEEVGEFEETWLAYIKDPTPAKKVDMMMEFGDVLVTLIILAAQLRIDPIECLELAYTKIKDRKGKTINGTFVKEEDLEEVEARDSLNDDLETQKLIEEKVGADLDWPEAWNDEK